MDDAHSETGLEARRGDTDPGEAAQTATTPDHHSNDAEHVAEQERMTRRPGDHSLRKRLRGRRGGVDRRLSFLIAG